MSGVSAKWEMQGFSSELTVSFLFIFLNISLSFLCGGCIGMLTPQHTRSEDKWLVSELTFYLYIERAFTLLGHLTSP